MAIFEVEPASITNTPSLESACRALPLEYHKQQELTWLLDAMADRWCFFITLNFNRTIEVEEAARQLERFACLTESRFIPNELEGVTYDRLSFIALSNHLGPNLKYHAFIACDDPELFYHLAKRVWCSLEPYGDVSFCELGLQTFKPLLMPTDSSMQADEQENRHNTYIRFVLNHLWPYTKPEHAMIGGQAVSGHIALLNHVAAN